MMGNNENDYFYKIVLAYEIPYNVLDSNDPDVVSVRENLYENLTKMVPEPRYDKFSTKLCLYQRKDTFNYIVEYTAFFMSTVGLPMEEYVEAEKLKEKVKTELETFFNSLDCEFKQLTLKILL